MVRMFNRAITKIHKDRYDLSMVYVDTLKRAAKEFGPNSKEAIDELAVIDEVLQVCEYYKKKRKEIDNILTGSTIRHQD